MKKRLDIRIESDLRDGLDHRVLQTGRQLTAIVEQYIKDGLARDAGQLVEIQSLPEIRATVREETSRAIGQLYQQLSTDLAKSAKKSDDRLAKLSANSVRNGGIAWRMLYALIHKLVSAEYAKTVYDDAKEKAGKALRNEDET